MSENTKQDFPLFFFLAIMTLGCVHVFRPHRRKESLGMSSSHKGGGRLLSPSKRKHVLKHAECHRCEEKILGIFSCNFSTSFKGTHFRKLPTESERSDRF